MEEDEIWSGGPFEFVRVGQEGDEKWKLMPSVQGSVSVNSFVARWACQQVGDGGTHKD